MNENDNIKRIQSVLRIGGYSSNPQDCANDLAKLAGEYSFICGQLEDILTRKAGVWNELRKVEKSDTATERKYQATEDGLNEQGLRLRAKGIEKMMSSLKSLLTLANNQAKNLY